MKARDLTDLALRNLREAILRNALTTLGVAVGVASLVAMLSLGVGLQQMASKRLSQSGLFDTIFVTTKNSFRGMGRPQREAQSDKPPRPLDEDARHELEKLPNVIEVYPQVRFYTEVRFNNKPYATVVAGLPESSRNSGAFEGMQGNFFSSPSADEAILQIDFAKDLSEKPASLVGQELTLRYAERQAIPAGAGEIFECRRNIGRIFDRAQRVAVKNRGSCGDGTSARLWRSWQCAIADAAGNGIDAASSAGERLAGCGAREATRRTKSRMLRFRYALNLRPRWQCWKRRSKIWGSTPSHFWTRPSRCRHFSRCLIHCWEFSAAWRWPWPRSAS